MRRKSACHAGFLPPLRRHACGRRQGHSRRHGTEPPVSKLLQGDDQATARGSPVAHWFHFTDGDTQRASVACPRSQQVINKINELNSALSATLVFPSLSKAIQMLYCFAVLFLAIELNDFNSLSEICYKNIFSHPVAAFHSLPVFLVMHKLFSFMCC